MAVAFRRRHLQDAASVLEGDMEFEMEGQVHQPGHEVAGSIPAPGALATNLSRPMCVSKENRCGVVQR